MKRLVKYLSIVLVAFSLVGCKVSSETSNIAINIGESTKFSEEEINNAIDCVNENFDFKGCTLTKISYDEAKSIKGAKDYLQYGKGMESNIEPENIIVLLSDFDVDDTGAEPALNPGETYIDYNWILVRDDKESNWKIEEWGY